MLFINVVYFRWPFVWLSHLVQCFHCSESAGMHMPNYLFMMLSPVCVYWVRQLSEDEVSFSLPALHPHSCWSNLSHLCRREGALKSMFFFSLLPGCSCGRLSAPWDHWGLKTCQFYVVGQSMAQCDLCNLPTWTSLGRWVSFMVNLYYLCLVLPHRHNKNIFTPLPQKPMDIQEDRSCRSSSVAQVAPATFSPAPSWLGGKISLWLQKQA